MRAGLPLPKRMQDAPVLALGLGLYYTAFMNLTTSRPMGMSEGPIPWHLIEQYNSLMELDPEERDDMHHHIRAMDDAYLKYRAKEGAGSG